MTIELLTLDDIADTRAYEREREAFRDRIIALKAVRRVHVGTVISLVFENRDTMRFQVQEMARVEKLTTDAQIQGELDVYNPLISREGRLTATLFIECTTDEQMREWFPKLVGIESALELRIGTGPDRLVVRSVPEAAHQAQLTRDEITSAVHYVHFDLADLPAPASTRARLAAALVAGPVELAVEHRAYRESTQLGEGTRAALAEDLL